MPGSSADTTTMPASRPTYEDEKNGRRPRSDPRASYTRGPCSGHGGTDTNFHGHLLVGRPLAVDVVVIGEGLKNLGARRARIGGASLTPASHAPRATPRYRRGSLLLVMSRPYLPYLLRLSQGVVSTSIGRVPFHAIKGQCRPPEPRTARSAGAPAVIEHRAADRRIGHVDEALRSFP